MVEPEGLDVWASVELTGLEAVWVNFHRRFEPVSPNIVQPLRLPSPPAAEAPAKRVYLYLAGPPGDLDTSVALLRLAAELQPEIGADVEIAVQADRVILYAPADAEEIKFQLMLRGIQVEMAELLFAGSSTSDRGLTLHSTCGTVE